MTASASTISAVARPVPGATAVAVHVAVYADAAASVPCAPRGLGGEHRQTIAERLPITFPTAPPVHLRRLSMLWVHPSRALFAAASCSSSNPARVEVPAPRQASQPFLVDHQRLPSPLHRPWKQRLRQTTAAPLAVSVAKSAERAGSGRSSAEVCRTPCA